MRSGRRSDGFTLMELVVVLFIVGLLAAIAIPNVSGSLTRAREAALAENLSVLRRAIDHYHGDKGVYPENLNVLVEDRYIQFIPDDPVADDDIDWVVEIDQTAGGLRDVRSGASGIGTNGVSYSTW